MADKMAEMGWDRAAEKMGDLFLSGEYAVKLLKDANPFRETPDDEPQRPVDCSNCGTSYQDCDTGIFNEVRACCHTCEYSATHEQNEWEAWKKRTA